MAIVRNIKHGGGSGGNSIIVVANYSALPDATTVFGEFYWCENSQGTSWLPGSLGGTYYNSGMYYSNGTSWSFVNVPYQATQPEVNTGTNDNKFVTPNTLKNSTQFQYLDATSSIQTQINSKLDKKFMNYSTMITAIMSNSSLTVVGITGANTESSGNTARVWANTNKFTTQTRLGYQTSAVAGNVSYFRQTADIVSMLYPFEAMFSFGKDTNVTGQRSCYGFINNPNVPANVEINTLLNSFGICELSTSNNWHIFTNNGTGLATTIDLGVNFPCRNNNTDVINAYFRNFPSVGIFYEIECNGVVVSGMLTTDLPTTATSLTYKWWTTNNTTASACAVAFLKFILNKNL